MRILSFFVVFFFLYCSSLITFNAFIIWRSVKIVRKETAIVNLWPIYLARVISIRFMVFGNRTKKEKLILAAMNMTSNYSFVVFVQVLLYCKKITPFHTQIEFTCKKFNCINENDWRETIDEYLRKMCSLRILNQWQIYFID